MYYLNISDGFYNHSTISALTHTHIHISPLYTPPLETAHLRLRGASDDDIAEGDEEEDEDEDESISVSVVDGVESLNMDVAAISPGARFNGASDEQKTQGHMGGVAAALSPGRHLEAVLEDLPAPDSPLASAALRKKSIVPARSTQVREA